MIKNYKIMDEIEIKLTRDEALVLYEFLNRFSETDTLTIEHSSEQRTLWNLTSILESTILEPFDNNYEDLLQAAKENLSD